MDVRYRKQFKKDYRLMLKRGADIGKLDRVIITLAIPETLDPSHRNHSLIGNYVGCQECHIAPDWLLIYEYETLDSGQQQLVCIRTGSHADLFE